MRVRHAMRMRHIMLSSNACLPLSYLSTTSHKQHNLGEKISEHKICVLILYTILSQTFFIQKRIQLAINKY